jgi:hypothetical protein
MMHNDCDKSYGIMNRTTIVLPDDIKSEAVKRAQSKGISFGAFVREAIARLLAEPTEDTTQRARREAIEAMLRFSQDAPPGPKDLAEHLDDYLYGRAKVGRKP